MPYTSPTSLKADEAVRQCFRDELPQGLALERCRREGHDGVTAEQVAAVYREEEEEVMRGG